MYSDRSNLYAFGVNTTEPYNGTGLAGLSFSPIQGAANDIGLLAKHSIAKLDNKMFYLGSDERGGIIVYAYTGGYTPSRISTHAIEREWDAAASPEDAYAFSFQIEGHYFYVLTFDGIGTFVFDAVTGLWSKWNSPNKDYWTPTSHAYAFNKRLIFDGNSNNIFEADLDTYTDNGVKFAKEAVSAVVQTPNNQRARHNFVRVDMETGVGDQTTTDPQVMLSWSQNGVDFSDGHWRSAGKVGERGKRVYWRRLGMDRQRFYKIRITDPVKVAIFGAYLSIDFRQGDT